MFLVELPPFSRMLIVFITIYRVEEEGSRSLYAVISHRYLSLRKSDTGLLIS